MGSTAIADSSPDHSEIEQSYFELKRFYHRVKNKVFIKIKLIRFFTKVEIQMLICLQFKQITKFTSQNACKMKALVIFICVI